MADITELARAIGRVESNVDFLVERAKTGEARDEGLNNRLTKIETTLGRYSWLWAAIAFPATFGYRLFRGKKGL